MNKFQTSFRRMWPGIFYALVVPPFLVVALMLVIGSVNPITFYLEINKKMGNAIDGVVGDVTINCSAISDAGKDGTFEERASVGDPWKIMVEPYRLQKGNFYKFWSPRAETVGLRCGRLEFFNYFFGKPGRIVAIPTEFQLVAARFGPPVIELVEGSLYIRNSGVVGFQFGGWGIVYLNEPLYSVAMGSNKADEVVRFSLRGVDSVYAPEIFVVKFPVIRRDIHLVLSEADKKEKFIHSSEFKEKIGSDLL